MSCAKTVAIRLLPGLLLTLLSLSACAPAQLKPDTPPSSACSGPPVAPRIDTARVDADTPWTLDFIGTNGLSAVLDIGDIEIVIDGGYRDDSDLVDHISSRNIIGDGDAIELVVLTHPDVDHWSGLSPLLRRFEWKDFWHSGYWPDHGLDVDGMAVFLRDVEQRVPRPPLGCRVPPATSVAGRQPTPGHPGTPTYRVTPFTGAPDLVIEVLHTNAHPETHNTIAGWPRNSYLRNNASVVLRITLPDGHRFLFTGDINGHVRGYSWEPAEVEAQLLHAHALGVDLSTDVLQIPHHGVPSSASPDFLAATSAGWAIFPAHSLFPGPWSRARILDALPSHAQALSTNAFFGEARHTLRCHAPHGPLVCEPLEDVVADPIASLPLIPQR